MIRIASLLVLTLLLVSCEAQTSDCGSYHPHETAFSHRDTFAFSWKPTRVWLQGVSPNVTVIPWEHADSVRIEIFVHGVLYGNSKVRFISDRANDSTFLYMLGDSVSAPRRYGATVDCDPAPFNLTKDVKVFLPMNKKLLLD
jgi:hypothetical protein